MGQPLFWVLSPLEIPYPPQPSSSPPADLVLMLVLSSCSQMFTSTLAEMSRPSPPRTLTTTWRPDCRGMTWGKERGVLTVPRPSSWPKDLPQCHLNQHDLVDFRCGTRMGLSGGQRGPRRVTPIQYLVMVHQQEVPFHHACGLPAAQQDLGH